LVGEQPEHVETHTVELMLPRDYPREKPYAVPLTSVFHPNIKEYVCIADYWAAGTTLVDVIAKMGDMIQWRIYNVASPLDGIAARWASQNEHSGLFPVGNVDLGVADVDIAVKSRSEAPPAQPASHSENLEPVTVKLPPADIAFDGLVGAGNSPVGDDIVVSLKRS
jgi:hypothetical protein